MTAAVQVLGTAVVVPTGGLTLPWTCVLSDGVSTTTLDSGDGADPVLIAGTYSPHALLNHVAKKLRASLFARMQADAWVTENGLVETDVVVQLGMPSAGAAAGVGATLLRIKVDTGGVAEGPSTGSVVIQSFSLVNTANQWCWLGLARPGETRSLAIVGGGSVDDTGRFQPRWLFALRASYEEQYAQEHPGHYTELFDDGSVSQYSFGARASQFRTLSLNTLPQHIVGPPWQVGLSLGTFGATRNVLNLQTMTETLFTGISSVDRRTDNLTSPAYIACGGWWARFYETSANTFVAYDVWPAAKTPKVGEPIYVWPEAVALVEEWKRTGLLFRYSPKDSDGSTTWLAEALAPAKQGAWRIEPRRRGGNSLYWSIDLPGLVVPNPELATP